MKKIRKPKNVWEINQEASKKLGSSKKSKKKTESPEILQKNQKAQKKKKKKKKKENRKPKIFLKKNQEDQNS